MLTVISSLFKTSKGKPMSNDDGKDDEVRDSRYQYVHEYANTMYMHVCKNNALV